MSPRNAWFGLVALAVVLSDQGSKLLVARSVDYRRGLVEVVPGLLQVVHVRNTGAAFGLLAGHEHRMAVFAAFTLFAIGVVVSLLRELGPEERYLPATLGLILGGAVGNGIDRLHQQSVTDFLRVYLDHPALNRWLLETFGTKQFPSFNLADLAICAGVGLFVLHYLFLQPEAEAA